MDCRILILSLLLLPPVRRVHVQPQSSGARELCEAACGPDDPHSGQSPDVDQ